jgi:3-oxoacyl-[acyl-carrier-protein] synthase-1
VLEELESALARGARVRAELVGYGTSSDGSNMVTPRAEGIARAMNMALEEADADVDYLNTHATSTQVGDRTELEAIREVFGEKPPLISSTKGLTGHAIGASGAHEAIFCLLMMERSFVAACANLFEPDPETRGLPLVTAAREASLETVMTNSLGFGGTNASLVFSRWHGKSG